MKSFLNCLLLVAILQTNSYCQELSKESGFFKDRFYLGGERSTQKEVRDILENDEMAFAYWKKSNTLSTLTWLSLVSEAGFAVWGFSEKNKSRNANIALGGTFVSMIGVFSFGFWSTSQRKKAISTYNQNNDKSNVFLIQPTGNGLSFIYRF